MSEYVIYERSKFDAQIIRVATRSGFVDANMPECSSAQRFGDREVAESEAERIRAASPGRHFSVELAPR